MSDSDLEELKALARSITDEDRQRFTPPSDLWSRIEAEAFGGLTESAAPVADAPDTDTGIRVETAEAPQASAPDLQVAPEPEPQPVAPARSNDVIDMRTARADRSPQSRRNRRRLALLGAAAAAVIAVFGISIAGSGNPTVTHVAQATNDGLPEAFSGAASVEAVLDDSRPILNIDFTSDLPTDEPVELWLIKEDLSDMRSLGLIEGGDSIEIPEGLDLSEFSVVDLSIEPNDGDPTHSGRSILRGVLTDSSAVDT